MCNLYSMTRNRDAIIRLFRISHNRAADFEPKSAIFPGNLAPIIRIADGGERELVAMSWGFPLLQKGKAAKGVTNAPTLDQRILQSIQSERGSWNERRALYSKAVP